MADEPDTRGVEPMSDEDRRYWTTLNPKSSVESNALVIFQRFDATIDAEVAKRRKADQAVGSALLKLKDARAEVQSLRAALVRIYWLCGSEAGREVLEIDRIAAAALDREGEDG